MIDFEGLGLGGYPPFLFAVVGFILLAIAGDWVVRGAVCLARVLGVSRLLIGLVVVAFGTSSPELVVSLLAAQEGQPGLAVGNVIGSNIANILMVLGVGAAIYPIAFKRNILNRDGAVMLGASGLLIWLALMEGEVAFTSGVVLVSMLALYIVYSYVTELKEERVSGKHNQPVDNHLSFIDRFTDSSTLLHLVTLIAGFVGLIVGAECLVYGAVRTASQLGVPEAIIGVTMVAFGTSVPELAAVSIAAMKRQPEMALGSVVGSNIFNILAVLGITSLVGTVPIAPEFINLDLWVMLAAAVLLLVFLVSGSRLSRAEGLFMVAAYLAYVSYLFYTTPMQDNVQKLIQ